MGKPEKSDEKQRKHRVRKLFVLAAAGVTVAAIVQELRKAEGERTWTGRVGGLVPYDLRWPLTVERVRAAWWNVDSDQVFTPKEFGVGWSINMARVTELLQDALEPPAR